MLAIMLVEVWALTALVLFVFAGMLALTYGSDGRRLARVAFAAPVWPVLVVVGVGWCLARLWGLAWSKPKDDALPLARAWDRGYTAGSSRAMRRMSDEPDVPVARNPYC